MQWRPSTTPRKAIVKKRAKGSSVVGGFGNAVFATRTFPQQRMLCRPVSGIAISHFDPADQSELRRQLAKVEELARRGRRITSKSGRNQGCT
jgi:hypothetical protein